MVRITNNKDKNPRYVVSGSVKEQSKFNEVLNRLRYFGMGPRLVFPMGNRLIATFSFDNHYEKGKFRDRYNLERQSMREEQAALRKAGLA